MLNVKNAIGLLAIVAATLSTAGCQPKVQVSHGEDFYPEGDVRASGRFVEVQTARGARADATLYPVHFDGACLNSLGEQKLTLMLHDDESCDPLVVYMNLPTDALSSARQDAAEAFLKENGLRPEQIKFVNGPNPFSKVPADRNLAAQAKIDSGDSGGGDSGGAAAAK